MAFKFLELSWEPNTKIQIKLKTNPDLKCKGNVGFQVRFMFVMASTKPLQKKKKVRLTITIVELKVWLSSAITYEKKTHTLDVRLVWIIFANLF